MSDEVTFEFDMSDMFAKAKKQQEQPPAPAKEMPANAFHHHWKPGSSETLDICQQHHVSPCAHEAQGGFCVWVYGGNCEQCKERK